MNKKLFAKNLMVFDLLDYKITKEFLHSLGKAYLIQPHECDKIMMQILNPDFHEVKNLVDLRLFLNFTDLYDVDSYGATLEEQEIIQLKSEIFEVFFKELGEKDIEWNKLSLWKHSNTAFSKRIIGLLYYYGLDRDANKKTGKKLLCEAAQNGDIDALLWCLYEAPDNEKLEYIEKILSSPESFAFTEWVEIFKENYNLTDVNVGMNSFGKQKIGF